MSGSRRDQRRGGAPWQHDGEAAGQGGPDEGQEDEAGEVDPPPGSDPPSPETESPEDAELREWREGVVELDIDVEDVNTFLDGQGSSAPPRGHQLNMKPLR